MILLFITLLFLLGFSLIHLYGSIFSFPLKVGTSFPISLGVLSIELFFLDILGLPINNSILILGLLVLQIGIVFYFLNQKDRFFQLTLPNFKEIVQLEVKKFSPAYLLLITLVTIVLGGTIAKAYYFPSYAVDSLVGGFDAIAKGIFLEGTYNNYVFDPNHKLISIRSTYPPLLTISFSLAYIFGLNQSKIIMCLFFFSTVFTFYNLLRQYATRVSSALFTLLLILSPEYLAFSSLSSSNPIGAYFLGMGLISLYIWADKKELAYFILGTTFMSFAIWTRTESIIFWFAGLLFFIPIYFKDKDFKKIIPFLITYILPSLLLFIVWQLNIKLNLDVSSGQSISVLPNLDFERIQLLLERVMAVTLQPNYYGYAIQIFISLILINSYFIFKSKDRLLFLGVVLSCWIGLILVYNQIEADYSWEKANSGDFINSGYKRSFFYFLPLIYFYAGSNYVSKYIFEKYLL